MVSIQKNRIKSGSNEEQIFKLDLINNLLDDRDKCNSFTIEKRGFIDYFNRSYNYGANFSLFDNVIIEGYLDGNKIMQKAKGYYSFLQKLTFKKKWYKKDYGTEVQYSYVNDKYEDTLLKNIYVYDMSMAFLSIVGKGFYPKTDGEEFGPGMVEENQIGFNSILGYLEVVETGYFASYRFEKAYEPKLKKWALDKFNQRKLLKSQGKDLEAAELKSAVVSALGILSNHNIFYRAYITGSISNYIRSLIDENTLIANTDSIISIGPRPDLDIGKGLGQFKIEQEDKYMIYEGSNYIIYNEPERKNILVNKWRARLKGAQDGYDPLTKMTSTPQNYVKIGDYVYGEKNNS